MTRRFVLAALIAVGVSTVALRWVQADPPVLQQAASAAQGHLDLKLPLEDKSVRFAVIGDNGTGDQPQYDVAAEMEAYHKIVGFDFVVMRGEKISGGQQPKALERKSEKPPKPLLDAGVKFYACLGNHGTSDEIQYKPFNMNGQHYYSF